MSVLEKNHPADIRVALESSSLEELFIDAARALAAIICSGQEKENNFSPGRELELEISGESFEQLLVNWLNELIYLFDSDQLIPVEYSSLSISGQNPASPGPHKQTLVFRVKFLTAKLPETEGLIEVKAATYHGLEIKVNERGRYTATVLFDI